MAVVLHEKQLNDEENWSTQPLYCLRRLDSKSVVFSSQPVGKWRSINCYSTNQNEVPPSSSSWSQPVPTSLSQSNLLQEAQTKCPHLSIPRIFEHYCTLTRGTQGTSALTRGTQGTSALTRGTQSTSALTRGTQGTSALTRGTQGTSALTRGTQGTSALTRGTQGTSALTRKTQGTSALRRETHSTSALTCSIPVVVEAGGIKVQLQGSVGNTSMVCAEDVSMLTQPWTHVYAPSKAEHMIGNSQASKTLVEWLLCWAGTTNASLKTTAAMASQQRTSFMKKQRQNGSTQTSADQDMTYFSSDEDESEEDRKFPSVALLHGPHGSGKTAAVYACAAEAGLEVFEINAGNLRSKTQILKKLREAFHSCQMRPFSWFQGQRSQVSVNQPTLVLVDEIDVILEEDVGFLQALQEVVASSSRPVVLTCSDCPWNFPLHTLNLHFMSPSQCELGVHLSLLGLVHQSLIPLRVSCEWSQSLKCDIRRALLDLQWLLASKQSAAATPSRVLHTAPATHPTIPCSSMCPWRPGVGVVTFNSELVTFCLKCDYQASLDCLMRSATNNISSVDDYAPSMGEPYRARLLPGLLDQLPNCVKQICPNNLTTAIAYEIDKNQLLDTPELTGANTRLWSEEARTLFPMQCYLYTNELAMECLPYLKMMYMTENNNRQTETKRRRPRHYFHSILSELKKTFSTDF